jgi:acyl carrier protein phosphodiesterase
MNFLAHIYLSGNNNEIMIGNFIADFVKGQKKNDFPTQIRQGIELHRAIDDYTDHHPITGESRRRLYLNHSKYSGVVVDLYYDHFLAKNFLSYSNLPLKDFAALTYKTILSFEEFLPVQVREFLPYMIERNWLLNYATIEGIGRTLTGLGKRVSFPNRMDKATIDLEMYYSDFEREFNLFFPQLINFVDTRRS